MLSQIDIILGLVEFRLHKMFRGTKNSRHTSLIYQSTNVISVNTFCNYSRTGKPFALRYDLIVELYSLSSEYSSCSCCSKISFIPSVCSLAHKIKRGSTSVIRSIRRSTNAARFSFKTFLITYARLSPSTGMIKGPMSLKCCSGSSVYGLINSNCGL